MHSVQHLFIFFCFIAFVKCLFTRVPRGLTGRVQLNKYVYIKKKSTHSLKDQDPTTGRQSSEMGKSQGRERNSEDVCF